jgi:hypothetical protein
MKLITNRDYAIVEYPPNNDPEFELDDSGVLMVFGYKIKLGEHEIGSMQRYETELKNYKIIGKYPTKIIAKEVAEIIEKCDIYLDNCIILIKKNKDDF